MPIVLLGPWAAPCARLARVPRRRPQLLTCTAFDEWLEANRLPGIERRGRSSSSADGVVGGAEAPPLAARRRFAWAEAPAIAAHCLQRHGQCRWELDAPGLLVASSSDGGGLVARLEVPLVLAGTHPDLFVCEEQLSPLPPRPEAEHQRLLQALARLAGSGGTSDSSSSSNDSSGGGSSGGSSSGGSNTALGREQPQIGSQLLVLLSADSAALALYSQGQLARHKVLTGYTVRKRQGKAQAGYERQGGGMGSVGGAIRARESRRLFQGAAATLASWHQDIAACSQLFRSGTVRAWNELYAAASPPPPLRRRDPRLRSVGVGVRRPRLADVERAYAVLSHGTLCEAE